MATHLRNGPRWHCEPILIERDKMVGFVEGDKKAILVEKNDDFATQIISSWLQDVDDINGKFCSNSTLSRDAQNLPKVLESLANVII